MKRHAKKKTAARVRRPTPRPETACAYTIPEFCAEHRISRPLYYKLRKAGLGPRIMRVGEKPLISVEAAADWRREREAASQAAAK
jgi:hypothetical protein